jgi:LPPG:FO 2-phospho-L-lactate transferase
MATAKGKVLALSGGVGGAKLSLGLADELGEMLHILVNTGDDFEHLGLHISPDIDTHLYTLSGRSNTQQGWGLEGESWNALDALEELGGETWFQLGDRDLATHLWRTAQLGAGESLAAVTAQLASRLGAGCNLHPMSCDPVRTMVHGQAGDLPFQHYFVRLKCEPRVSGFSFAGIENAQPDAAVMAQLAAGEISRVVICPSNPFVSIDPILQLPGLSNALRDCAAPVVLICPIVAGMAIKGPTAKMMAELGMPVTAPGVAQYYCERYPGLLDCFVIDQSDAELADEIRDLGVEVSVTSTVMNTRADKRNLARYSLQLPGVV